MHLSNLIKLFQQHNYQQIMVTGPQRSGTTIAAKILSEELGFPNIDEGCFETHNVEKCLQVYRSMPQCVIQAPAMSAYANLMPGVIVFMRRPIHEIILSQRRVSWPSCEEEREKAKYFLKEDRYPIAEIKYRIWDEYQKRLPRRYELFYYSMQSHKLWVEGSQRKKFGIKQTQPEDETMNSGSGIVSVE